MLRSPSKPKISTLRAVSDFSRSVRETASVVPRTVPRSCSARNHLEGASILDSPVIDELEWKIDEELRVHQPGHVRTARIAELAKCRRRGRCRSERLAHRDSPAQALTRERTASAPRARRHGSHISRIAKAHSGLSHLAIAMPRLAAPRHLSKQPPNTDAARLGRRIPSTPTQNRKTFRVMRPQPTLKARE